jgi:crotonobetainyl-CoA:carnitine CoA-transferase CaiB-like acyl-CoA transferase
MDAILEPTLAQGTSDDWAQRMDAAGVPCSPVNTIDTVLALPQMQHRQMVVDVPRDDLPGLKLPGVAIKLGDTPGTIRRPPPKLGEHTDEVLAEAGYAATEIAALRERGVV